MPELPEVEVIRRGLEKHLQGTIIREVELQPCRIFQMSRPRRSLAVLKSQTIQQIGRRGKYLIWKLDQHLLVVHLGMTGQFTVRIPELADSPRFLRHPTTGLQRIRQHAPDRHTHLQLHLRDGRSAFYRDIRKFGRVYLFRKSDSGLETLFSRLGLEPLSTAYRWEPFAAALKGRRTTVKALLLNQSIVAGIGNIYADEILFQARIHPLRRVNSLRLFEKSRLFEAIAEVLERGIRFGGTTLRDYVASDGQRGSHQHELKVYGRQGQPCLRCRRVLKKIVVAQRGTHFCPHCQPRSRPAGT